MIAVGIVWLGFVVMTVGCFVLLKLSDIEQALDRLLEPGAYLPRQAPAGADRPSAPANYRR